MAQAHATVLLEKVEDAEEMKSMSAVIENQLKDVEAHALFSQVRAWIKTDARPETEQPEDRIPIEYRTVH